MRPFLIICSLLFFSASPLLAQKKYLKKLLRRHPEHFGELLRRPGQYDVQIIYTRIDRDADNVPHFTSFTYGLDAGHYFYPASTVKMPAAFLAIEKVNQLKINGLDRNSTMLTSAGSPPQTAVEADSTAASGLPSVAHYAKKIFLVSDNDAFNRLYELLGQAGFNERLWEKGFNDVCITHRLAVPEFDSTANQFTNPIRFLDGDKLLYQQPEVRSRAGRDFVLRETQRGSGYIVDGALVEQPFDFSKKNYISLQNLHDLLKSVLFPEAVPAGQRFQFSEADYRFLYQVMSEKPAESQFPLYAKPDNYCKFFLFGDRPETDTIPGHLRIFNKVGWAYGFLTDVAYVVDFEAKVEFMLAATIHVNEDGVFNDDAYEYETVGLPFFGNLGRLIYGEELRRPRKFRPNLDKFRVRYD